MKRLLCVVLLAAALPACNAQRAATDAKAGPTAPAIKAGHPERKTVRRTIDQPGQITAVEETPLHAKIAGFVKLVHCDIGDVVEKDQVLAELSVPELVEEGKQKQALVEYARSEIKQAESAQAAADAKFKTSEAMVAEAKAGRSRAVALVSRWASEYDRMTKVSKSTLDQQTVDEAQFQLKAAEATREEVDAKVRSAEAARAESEANQAKAAADVSSARSRLAVAEADERRLAALLSYTKITAPFKGVVTQRHVDLGHFLSGAAGGKGSPLFVVSRQDVLTVQLDVPEADASLVAKDTTARVRVQALRGGYEGKVTRTAGTLDPRSRTLRAEIDLPNRDHKLLPGMYAYVSLGVERKEAWTLPAAAVATQGDQAYCYRVEDGKAVRTPMQIGISGGGLVEVLKWQRSGEWVDVRGDETVVLNNLAGLTDGQSVK